MILRLKEILVEQEGLQTEDKVCPYLSRYEVVGLPMQKEPEFRSFTVLCLDNKCGRYNSCMGLTPSTRGNQQRARA
jgi:hypothetical protein